MLSSDSVGGSADNDPSAATTDDSLDSILGWLRLRRGQLPTAPLVQLLGDKRVAEACLVDVACIDLIQQRRAGHTACVEDYLRDFPELNEDSARLDLIDAEICVGRELQNTPNLEELVERFPHLRAQIADLLQMDRGGDADLVLIPDLGDDQPHDHLADEAGVEDSSEQPSLSMAVVESSRSEEIDGAEFSFTEAPLVQSESGSHPIDVPQWFLGDHCVASGPGHWLIRGRDATRGENLVMKVIELPLQVTHHQIEQLMDACEKAAKVRHPAWVLPAVAAVQARHLAVIRPWVFANPWRHPTRRTEMPVRLRQLASVAYALQSAHDAGAAHGGVHASNLLIDHDGKVQVIDGNSTTLLAKRWFQPGETFASWSRRQQWDLQDFIKLVATEAVDWPGSWADKLVPQLRGISEKQNEQACGRIGDALIQWADRRPADPANRDKQSTNGTTFRERFAKWISRSST